MYPFTYIAVTNEGRAIESGRAANTMFLAGGTNLLDEMKLNVRRPEHLVDINALPLAEITDSNGGLKIGALVKNSDLAYDKRVMERYPVLSEALLSGASAQLRNMATTGGNLLQKTRCTYYRDTEYEQCNKRNPGSGCAAIDGVNRMHALLGTSDKCIATHPSDMCVALMALDARLTIVGPPGEEQSIESHQTRTSVKLSEFYVPYGEDPAKENILGPGQLIEFVELPSTPWFKRSLYLKSRDRASYEFALASAAVAIDLDGQTIRDARVALGGVGTKPWLSTEAMRALVGKPATDATFHAAADAALKDAKPQKHNEFKIDLAKRTLVAALQRVVALP